MYCAAIIVIISHHTAEKYGDNVSLKQIWVCCFTFSLFLYPQSLTQSGKSVQAQANVHRFTQKQLINTGNHTV